MSTNWIFCPGFYGHPLSWWSEARKGIPHIIIYQEQLGTPKRNCETKEG